MAPLAALTMPAPLHAALRARLDRLGPAKGVAPLGATIGREFSSVGLQAVAGEAARLSQRGRVPDATYRFKPARMQEAA